jgi:hypothetical protein
VLGVSLLLVILNFAYMQLKFQDTATELANYDMALKEVPSGKSLLPVGTISDVGRVQPFMHRASFYRINQGDKPSIYPYFFSGNYSDPQRYFLTEDTVWRPDMFWYLRNKEIDWERVSSNYNYLIITKPYKPERLSKLHLEPTFENATAAVFKIAN